MPPPGDLNINFKSKKISKESLEDKDYSWAWESRLPSAPRAPRAVLRHDGGANGTGVATRARRVPRAARRGSRRVARPP